MSARKLTDSDLEKLRPWAEKVVERIGEYDADEVLQRLADKFEEHSAKPVFSNKPKVFLLNRAKSSVNTDLIGIGSLEKIPAIPIGPSGRAKDWSKYDYDAIQDEAKKGKEAVWDLLKEGKIAGVEVTVETAGGVKDILKPVRKLLAPMQKVKIKIDGKDKTVFKARKWLDKEETLPAYELWEPGDPVVPLDTREMINDDLANWRWTNVLEENWSVGIYFIIWKDEASYPSVAQFQIYGDPANPNSKDYILDEITRKGLWMKPVILKAEFNEKKCKDGKVFLKTGKNNRYAIKAAKATEFDLYEALMEGMGDPPLPLALMPNYTGDPHDGLVPLEGLEITLAGGNNPKTVEALFPILDLENLREYHEKVQMTQEFKTRTNRKGEQYESQVKNYDCIGLMECTIMPTKEPEEGNSIIVTITDNTLTPGRFSAFLPDIYDTVPFNSDAADVLMFVTTGKKSTYYDKDLMDNVKDEDGTRGDITVNVIGLEVLMERDMEEKEDKPDPNLEGPAAQEEKGHVEEEARV